MKFSINLFRKIKLRTPNKVRYIYLSKLPLLKIEKINGKTKYTLPFWDKKKVDKNAKGVFYLKVNSTNYYALKCIQLWVNIVYMMGADFYFVCDNYKLEREILKTIKFKDSNIKFIKSYKRKLKGVIHELIMKRWYKAGYAHLTTFHHAVENNIKEFWNIDADDTLFCLYSYRVSQILQRAEQEAIERDLDLLSFDMWATRTRNKAWTFGVTYVRNPEKFIRYTEAEKRDWMKDYINCDNHMNIDWFATYLRNENKMNIGSFYVENLYFVHYGVFGDFLHNIFSSSLNYWDKGKVYFPIISKVFEDDRHGILNIPENLIQIKNNLTKEEGREFMDVALINHYSPALKDLWHYDSIIEK